MIIDLVQSFGLLGWLLVAFVTNTILPIPFEPMLVLIPEDPWIWLFLAGLGAMLGEFTLYLLARKESKYISKFMDFIYNLLKGVDKRIQRVDLKEIMRGKGSQKARMWFEKWGALTLFVAAVTPLPMIVFDVIAGHYKYDWKKFMIITFLGKLCRFGLIWFYGMWLPINWLLLR